SPAKTNTRRSRSKSSRSCFANKSRAESVRRTSAQPLPRRCAQRPHEPSVIVLVARAPERRLQIAEPVPAVELERRLHLRDGFEITPHVQELSRRREAALEQCIADAASARIYA